MTETDAGRQWRSMRDAARAQLDRLGDPGWTTPADRYSARVESFRGPARSDDGVVPGSAADERLEAAMETLLADWGDGQLGPMDRRAMKLAIVRWPIAR